MNSNSRLHNNHNFLRLFAAICITFTHSFDLLKQSDFEPLAAITYNKITFSFIGLCVFFSCSGYLIAKSACTSTSFKNYIWKRFLRIQPLLIIWCCIAVFVVGFLFTTLHTGQYFNNKHTWLYFRNAVPVFGIQYTLPQVFSNNIAENGVNGSLWTLVIEERLYLLIALVFVFKPYSKQIFVAFIGILNVIYCIHLVVYQAQLIPYFDTSPFYYSLVFLNSSLLYFTQIVFSKKISWLFIANGFVVFFSIFFSRFQFLQPIFIPIFIIGFANLKGLTNYVGKYGDFTYGIYLFSFPVQQILIAVFNIHNSYCLFACTMVIVLPISIISWFLFEKKMLSLKTKFI
jgi:peptidoglycan/LPS O-acetylase OafA/YrhL